MRLLFKSFLILLSVACFLATVSAQTDALDKTAPRRARRADLEGREWDISSYFSDKSQKWPRFVPHPHLPHIAFVGGIIEGSPGCGLFTGSYRRSGEQLTIFAGWTDDKKEPCGDGDKLDAEQILIALIHVQRKVLLREAWFCRS